MGFIQAFQRFWQRSNASDYVGLGVILGAYVLIQIFIEPFHRMFTLNNVAIQYPHALVERVPIFWLFVYSIGVPLVSILLFILLTKRDGHKMNVTILGLFIALFLTSFITDVIKNAVGRPRPDLIARCKPEKGTPANKLVTWRVCTETDSHTLHDGWRSFPSGHSSFAFAGLGFLSLFLAGQLHSLRPRTDLARGLLALAPLLGAALIAISRCEDYRHDVYDVTIGSILGFLVAHFSYRRYYPALRSTRCDQPYPVASEAISGRGKSKARDEEMVGSVRDFDIGDEETDGEGERLPLATSISR
ncbi:pap2 domain protein [Venturia nashicola]|nr:pap2 domain protein [Venturia nashicola]